MGQLRVVLRAKYLVDAAGYNKIQGQPFKQAGTRTKRSKKCLGRMRPRRSVPTDLLASENRNDHGHVAGLTKKDFQTDQEIRWCPGCGDYAILSAVQAVFPELGIQRENFVVVSGIGCSSRFPYYMNTFGFHTIHGRAPAVATGIEGRAPRAGSLGGHRRRRFTFHRRQSHHSHAAAQCRPESAAVQQPHLRADQGTIFADFGNRQENEIHSVRHRDRPFNPLSLAIGAEATFVARSVDVFQQHLKET